MPCLSMGILLTYFLIYLIQNESRCMILLRCRCAPCPPNPPTGGEGGCPGARTITNLSWVQELSKNRNKPIKHTVRVRLSPFYIF